VGLQRQRDQPPQEARGDEADGHECGKARRRRQDGQDDAERRRGTGERAHVAALDQARADERAEDPGHGVPDEEQAIDVGVQADPFQQERRAERRRGELAAPANVSRHPTRHRGTDRPAGRSTTWALVRLIPVLIPHVEVRDERKSAPG
jgi:hypothetical protein